MQLVVTPAGAVRCLYDERIDLADARPPGDHPRQPRRADPDGRWTADLAPVGGPVLGPFVHRSEALDAERAWLEAHWLVTPA